MELAIIKSGGKQYLVSPGQKIEVEKIEKKEGEEVVFDEVLLVKKNDEVKIGKPKLEGIRVIGKILKQKRGKKIIVLKHKPRKRYKVKKGHRQFLTEIEILKIEF